MKFYGYLFVYFAGEKYDDGEQIFFAVSKDGLHWQDLNRNKPILVSTLGEKGVRDPFIVRSEIDRKFYLLATDLNINADGDWARSSRAGSKSIIRWESEDLLNWSEHEMIPIAVDDAGCTWAPEATYDKTANDYLVYWASSRALDDFSHKRMYCARTKDFRTFTKPELYIERKDTHILDTTIIQDSGIFYRFSNDGLCKCISCEQMYDLMGSDAHFVCAPVLSAQKQVEGPFAFQLNGQNKWCLLLDENGGIGYYPLITDDLASGVYQKLERNAYRMPSRARHGSVISITQKEFETLVRQWGDTASFSAD